MATAERVGKPGMEISSPVPSKLPVPPPVPDDPPGEYGSVSLGSKEIPRAQNMEKAYNRNIKKMLQKYYKYFSLANR